MVSSTTYWKCDKCNTVYDTQTKAQDCENTHYKLSDFSFDTVRWEDFQEWPEGVRFGHTLTGEKKKYRLIK